MKINIKREQYLEKVKPFVGNEIIKVITGQRRVGKSYFLYQIADYIKEKISQANIIFIDKEKFDFIEMQNAGDLVNYVESKINKKKFNAVFIDEVQEIGDFQKAIRNFFNKGYDVYITGSNSTMLSGELATMLSGRYMEIKILPLTYKEFLKFNKLDNSELSVEKYIRFGGMPYLRNLELDFDLITEYLKGIFGTIILKDVVKRHNIRQIDVLDKLVLYIADNIGNIVSAKKISDFLKSQHLKISPSIILNYLLYLNQAFFVNRVRRYDLQGKRYLEVLEKYYFTDTGIRNVLVGFKPQDIGYLMENVVYNHLTANNYKVSIGKLYDYEIDFIAEKGNEKKYIQVAYLLNNKKTVEREFGNLTKIKDSYPKYVISYDSISFDSYEGIKHLKLFDFLNNG